MKIKLPTNLLFKTLWLVCIIFGCSEEKQKSTPDEYFTQSQKQSLLKQVVIKTAKKPEAAYSAAEINAYYEAQSKDYQWHFAFEKNGRFFIFVSRSAPSLYGKRIGIAGVLNTSNHLNINGFKEIFRTFKMKPEILKIKGATLFEKMVNGEDLSVYNPNPQKTEEWIEFPDEYNYYDSTSQTWKMKGL